MRFSVRPLIAATVLAVTLVTGACGSDDRTTIATPTTSTPALGVLSDIERREAYEFFLLEGRQQKIDDRIKSCGDSLLARVTADDIPMRRSGPRKIDPAPTTGLGLLSYDPHYLPPREPSQITLTVYYNDGQVTAVHGIEVQYGDVMYLLRGARVTRSEGNSADNGIDAYTWEIHRNGVVTAIALGKSGDTTEISVAEHPGRVSLADNFSVLGTGFDELSLTDSGSAAQISAAKIQEGDTRFLNLLPCGH